MKIYYCASEQGVCLHGTRSFEMMDNFLSFAIDDLKEVLPEGAIIPKELMDTDRYVALRMIELEDFINTIEKCVEWGFFDLHGVHIFYCFSQEPAFEVTFKILRGNQLVSSLVLGEWEF